MPPADPTRNRPGVEPEGPILYAEDGWSWAWILAAPLFCLAAGLFEVVTGAPVHWLMLTVCAVASAACHAVMIAATRVHGRIRLTPTAYYQGTEELELARVATVLPPAAGEAESWQSARTLGELREVPRRRGAVGLRLDSGAEVRAWGRRPERLREALAGAVAAVGGGTVGDASDAGGAGGAGTVGGDGTAGGDRRSGYDDEFTDPA